VSPLGTGKLRRSIAAVFLLLVLAMVPILAQTMGSASAAPKAGHGHGGGGSPHTVELTSQVTRHGGSRGHSSQGDQWPGQQNEHSRNDQFGNRGNGRGHNEVTGYSGHERAAIASPITLPASTVPNTTVPRTTPPTTRPPATTVTTVPATTPPTVPPTAPPTVPATGASGGSSPGSGTTSTAGSSTSSALGGVVSFQGVAVVQVVNKAPAPSTTTATKARKGENASPGSAAPEVSGLSGVLPMVAANGDNPFQPLQAATDLKVPILFGVVVALFILGQALIDRRDPKMSRAPERNDEDTVGFQ